MKQSMLLMRFEPVRELLQSQHTAGLIQSGIIPVSKKSHVLLFLDLMITISPMTEIKKALFHYRNEEIIDFRHRQILMVKSLITFGSLEPITLERNFT